MSQPAGVVSAPARSRPTPTFAASRSASDVQLEASRLLDAEREFLALAGRVVASIQGVAAGQRPEVTGIRAASNGHGSRPTASGHDLERRGRRCMNADMCKIGLRKLGRGALRSRRSGKNQRRQCARPDRLSVPLRCHLRVLKQ